MSDLRDKGMKIRREVLGDAHVDRAEKNKTDFDAPFQEMITDAAWGHVWSSDHFSNRERSIVTIALLAGLGHSDELAMHIKACVNTGATREDVREALMHVAIYAGVPAANHAFAITKKVFAEMDKGAS